MKVIAKKQIDLPDGSYNASWCGNNLQIYHFPNKTVAETNIYVKGINCLVIVNIKNKNIIDIKNNVKKFTMPMNVGDKVTTKFHIETSDIIRKITQIEFVGVNAGSGYLASADGGGICPHCNRAGGKDIFHIDLAWFEKIE